MPAPTAALTDELARELLVATDSRTPVPPLSERYPQLSLDDAYAVQLAQQVEHEGTGRRLVGRKIGLTSAAMQRQLGIDSPDFGYFFADMVYADGDEVPAGRFIAPRVEPEFAFVLGTDLVGPGVTVAEAGAAVASVHAALEIIDSRIADWRIALVDTVADNASCGAIVLGPELVGPELGGPELGGPGLGGIDPTRLHDVACSLVIDGEVARTGHGRDVMGDPLAALAWLANTLGARGVAIRAGEVVLPGAFVAAAPVAPGTTAGADFGALGGVTVTFTD